MKLRVLALDYDGTVARDGFLDPAVRAALEEARAAGLVVVLVTGRILADLRGLVGDLLPFDAVVAENGAVLSFPGAGRSSRLAASCAGELVGRLREQGLEVREGLCVVELDAREAHRVLDAVRELELPLTLHFNRGRLMVLPQAVSKATGLREALRSLRLSPHNAIGIGDAENDHELLSACELGVAVAWGSPALIAAADRVLEGDGPSAVAAFVREVAGSTLVPTTKRSALVLGQGEDGRPVGLAAGGRNVLIAGDPRSGKSWVAGLLCEQLLLQGYCVCLIDPEGDYGVLETLPGVTLLGGEDRPPSMQELARTLRHADVSVVLDLARLSHPEKRDYVARALQAVAGLRRETGLPHRIVVDEAHYFLHDPEEARLLDHELAGYTLITYRASGLHPDVLAATESIVVTRETDVGEARLLHAAWQGSESVEHWETTLRGLELDEAVLLPVERDAGGVLRRFRLAPRLTRHVRHRHKYLDVPVRGDRGFHFELEGGRRGPVARSLQELVDVLAVTPPADIAGHVRRGDLSRWIGGVFQDGALAERVAELEQQHESGALPDFGGAVLHAVEERYRVTRGAGRGPGPAAEPPRA